ncbi:MAG: 50S ribosomal protein L10 [Ferrimicrobium sp.]
MDNPRPQKVAIVAELLERLRSSEAVFVTEYRSLRVSELAKLRWSLRDAGGEYKVFKNTLVRIAARESGLEVLEELLTGPTGLTFVDGDVAAVAKCLRDFSRTNAALVLKGGLLSGSLIDTTTIAALADLPTRDVLLAQVAGALAAPMRSFAGVLQAVPRNFAYGLSALRDQRDAAA